MLPSEDKGRNFTKNNYKSNEWVNNLALQGNCTDPLQIYCNRNDDIACMNFVKAYKSIGKFYCKSHEFSENTESGNYVEMKNDAGDTLRVIPSGYHNYNNFFFIDDLLKAGICVSEILCFKNKNL